MSPGRPSAPEVAAAGLRSLLRSADERIAAFEAERDALAAQLAQVREALAGIMQYPYEDAGDSDYKAMKEYCERILANKPLAAEYAALRDRRRGELIAALHAADVATEAGDITSSGDFADLLEERLPWLFSFSAVRRGRTPVSPERLAEIRRLNGNACDDSVTDLLAEIDALTRERDEALAARYWNTNTHLEAENARLAAAVATLREALSTIYKIAAGGDVRRTAYEALAASAPGRET